MNKHSNVVVESKNVDVKEIQNHHEKINRPTKQN